jgi:hypothetical protein
MAFNLNPAFAYNNDLTFLIAAAMLWICGFSTILGSADEAAHENAQHITDNFL